MAPANTGSDNRSNTAVMKIAQQNNGNLCNVIPGCIFNRSRLNIDHVFIFALRPPLPLEKEKILGVWSLKNLTC